MKFEKLEYKRVNGEIEIYVDDKFRCKCKDMEEVFQELDKIDRDE